MNFEFPTFPAFLVGLTALTGGIWLFDALFLASRRKARLGLSETAEDEQKSNKSADGQRREPVVVEYAKSFFPVILIVLLLRSFLVEPFKIPSGSMMPTLLVGDLILVNKYAYGLRLPVLHTKILDVDEPAAGDVFVFRYPSNPRIDYIKRVIGVPGDHIEYRNKTLYINGKEQPKDFLRIYQGVGGGARETGVQVYREDLQGIKHDILVNPRAPDFSRGCQELQHGGLDVPDGHYFAMGDNRDNSWDGRCWGLVPEENLVGRAFAIWMNWDGEKQGFPVDWSRIGTTIE